MKNNLIDSNVCLRAIMFSLHHFNDAKTLQLPAAALPAHRVMVRSAPGRKAGWSWTDGIGLATHTGRL